jgi:type IV pilus assembly protein PilB
MMIDDLTGRLEECLVRERRVRKKDLAKACSVRARTGESLGRVLVRMDLIAEEDLLDLLVERLYLPRVDLEGCAIGAEVLRLVPEKIAREHGILPLFKIQNVLTVAMADPLDAVALEAVSAHTNCEVEIAVARASAVADAIRQYYGDSGSFADLVDGMHGLIQQAGTFRDDQPERMQRLAEGAPVVDLVNSMINQAIRERASDVHVEPGANEMRIRFRVDGRLREFARVPQHLHLPMVSRIKIMSNIDIAERRIPQDGQVEINLGDRVVDLRVATYPSIYGEKIAIRILDRSMGLMSLRDLGLPETLLPRFEEAITNPYGLFLVVGPTGAGKSTTLYAVMQRVRADDKNAITIEDPVEYTVEGMTQGQVNINAGLTFPEGLRAMVRQDPDIIMIGEIRDLESAEIAVRAALTGHQVFSTLHTQTAASAVNRLLDMGLDSYLVASSLEAVVAQRLVRRICPHCRAPYDPGDTIRQDFALARRKGVVFYRGKGCSQCRGSGYLGRVGLYELLTVDERIRELITARTSADVIQALAVEHGMRTMREDGLDKVLAGQTSFEEVIHATVGDSSEG